MGQTTVTQFAGELKMPASVLLEQLQKAGVDKARETDLLSEQDKTRLLDFLRRSHGDTAAKSKITLTRKQTSEIKATDATGRARTVQVEVRKKRVFVKRDEALVPESAASAAATVDENVTVGLSAELEPLVEVVEQVAAPVAVEPVPELAPEPVPEPVVEVAPEPVPEPIPEPVQPAPAPEAAASPATSSAVGSEVGPVIGPVISASLSVQGLTDDWGHCQQVADADLFIHFFAYLEWPVFDPDSEVDGLLVVIAFLARDMADIRQ